MSKVVIETFEVIGTGLPIASEYFAEFDSARSAQWGFVNLVGATGFRPCRTGTITTLFFDAKEPLPTGWRGVGTNHAKIEARPDRRYAAGRKAADEIAKLPRTPKSEDLAYRLGYNPTHFPIDGLSIYFASHVRCLCPSERIFVRIPRTATDGFQPDAAKLRLVEKWELEKAVADHNAVALRQQEQAA